MKSKVEHIEYVEELTVEHISTVEDRVQEISMKEEELKKNFDAMGDAMNVMKQGLEKIDTRTETIDTRTEKIGTSVGATRTKVEEINSNVIASAWLSGWRYQGRGTRGAFDSEIWKYTTFTDCVMTCEKKRAISGTSWNGMVWGPHNQYCGCYQNDSEHSLSETEYMHFKI